MNLNQYDVVAVVEDPSQYGVVVGTESNGGVWVKMLNGDRELFNQHELKLDTNAWHIVQAKTEWAKYNIVHSGTVRLNGIDTFFQDITLAELQKKILIYEH